MLTERVWGPRVKAGMVAGRFVLEKLSRSQETFVVEQRKLTVTLNESKCNCGCFPATVLSLVILDEKAVETRVHHRADLDCSSNSSCRQDS